MILLLTGATGFLGRHLVEALLAEGHQVICAVRHPASQQLHDDYLQYVEADFTQDFDTASWLPRLQGVDAVINAVGIIRESGQQTFDAIHVKAPQALFAACEQVGVRLVIQVSALGADVEAHSRYHRSKKEADDYLATLNVPSVILQPSLIYGDCGTSAKWFTMLASLPLIPLPGDGQQKIQPVHVKDVTAIILALLKTRANAQFDMLPDMKQLSTTRLAVVGPKPLPYRNFLDTLRTSMHLKRPVFISIPRPLMQIVARISRLLPGSLLDDEILQMLERGNTADATPASKLLRRPLIPADQFIPPHNTSSIRMQAQLSWLLPLLRVSIALVWIVTGILSAGLFPVEESYALLARVGISAAFAPVMLYGAALLDLVFGIATLFLKRRRWLWIAQLTVILFYTAVISLNLPEFWLHPYGPLLKNIPMLAAIFLLMEMEN